MARSWLLLAGCMLLVGPAWAATPEEVEASRVKGIEFLKSQQSTDGSWDFPNYTTGITALCTLALVENGVPLSDPAVDKGYRFVKKQATDVDNTYEVALSVLLLARVGDRADRSTIRTLGARLLAGQNEGGGWGYKCPKTDASILSKPDSIKREKGLGDNSCTQFGVLGLWVASRYGVPIESAMVSVASRFLDGQNEDGGWSYSPSTREKPEDSRNTMTCAGLFSLTVARATRIREEQKNKPANTEVRGEKATLLADPVYAKGFEKVGQYATGVGPGAAKYFLWSIERLGVLLGLEKLGTVDWFASGSDALVKTQRPDGGWSEGKERLSDTSFAILFLRKANLGSDISRLLEGEPDQQFSIPSRAGAPRFTTLADALAAATAGDVIRIDGNGPFKLSHDVFDKDLTLQAGFGYEPVFELEIGLNKLGLRYRPEKDVEAQHMLKVAAGTLTLEGLKFQLDPPISSKPIPWKAILVEGGSLRLLNCSISEGNRRGMASVVLAGTGSVYARNTMLIGGRAGVEVVANGEPQRVTLENCLLYTPIASAVVPQPEKKSPADVTFELHHCCVQADEAFAAANVTGNIGIESFRCLYKCDGLAVSLLPSTSSNAGRSWRGEQNVYNVKNWVGALGKPNTKVTNPASFSKFWGDTDTEGGAQTIAWINPRKNGGFTHVLNPQDWDLGEKSELGFSTTRYGIAAQSVGSGAAYSRYREEFGYNAWKRGVSEPDRGVIIKTP
jgi:hypothetical protein